MVAFDKFTLRQVCRSRAGMMPFEFVLRKVAVEEFA